MTTTTAYRLGLALSVLTVLFLLYGVTALGVIGEGGRPDRMYVAVLVVAVVGSLVARLRPRGMVLALAATALAQGVVTIAAIALGFQDTPGASVLEIVGLNAMYAGMFLASAWLFHRASEQPSRVMTPA